jgi:hypothetical protein
MGVLLAANLTTGTIFVGPIFGGQAEVKLWLPKTRPKFICYYKAALNISFWPTVNRPKLQPGVKSSVNYTAPDERPHINRPIIAAWNFASYSLTFL